VVVVVQEARSIVPIKKTLKANKINLFFNLSLHFHLFVNIIRGWKRVNVLQPTWQRFKAAKTRDNPG
jgi:hypothetical protein